MPNSFKRLQIYHKAHKAKQRFVFSLVFLVVSAFDKYALGLYIIPLYLLLFGFLVPA